MTKPTPRDPIYRRRRFQAEDIEQCVRWYISYRLSYRDLVAMMAERGVVVSHTTILRWVLRYVPEFEKRWARYKRPVQPSWRIDETAVPVRGGRHYLYRAVDKCGMTVNSLLCTDRSVFSAEEFFRITVARNQCWPRKVNLDGNAPRVIEHCGCFASRIRDGDPSSFAVAAISTTLSSRTTGRSNAAALLCWGSSPFGRQASLSLA